MPKLSSAPVSQLITPPANYAFPGVSSVEPDPIDETEIGGFYGRFSTDLQRDTSIDDQLHQCRQAAERLGYRISEDLILADEAISGTSMHNRPALKKLLGLVKQKPSPFKVLFVDQTSRLARNLEELLRVYKILKFYGVDIHVASTGLDSRSQGFEWSMTFAGAMDEQFIRGIKDSSRRGAVGSINRGYTPGGGLLRLSQCRGRKSDKKGE